MRWTGFVLGLRQYALHMELPNLLTLARVILPVGLGFYYIGKGKHLYESQLLF
jgi:phosphatidylglycerophosphate synthase